jgi:hypothetical protein
LFLTLQSLEMRHPLFVVSRIDRHQSVPFAVVNRAALPRLEVPRRGVVLRRNGARYALTVNLMFANEVAAPVGQDADGQRPIKTLGWGGVVCDALHGVVSL